MGDADVLECTLLGWESWVAAAHPADKGRVQRRAASSALPSPSLPPLPSPLVPGQEGGCHRGPGWSMDESEQIASAFTMVGL